MSSEQDSKAWPSYLREAYEALAGWLRPQELPEKQPDRGPPESQVERPVHRTRVDFGFGGRDKTCL